jgi:hypothetical protein
MLLTLWCTACRRHSSGTSWYARCVQYCTRSADQDDQEQRERERQVTHPALHAVAGGPAEQLVHQQVGRQQHEADHHVVDDEVVEVGLPLGAEHRLVAAQREQLLDEHEDQRRAEQVEDEPVEADVGVWSGSR